MITHVSIQEAAERYSCHEDTIRRAIKRRDIKAVKLSKGLIRIPVKSLEQWGN